MKEWTVSRRSKRLSSKLKRSQQWPRADAITKHRAVQILKSATRRVSRAKRDQEKALSQDPGDDRATIIPKGRNVYLYFVFLNSRPRALSEKTISPTTRPSSSSRNSTVNEPSAGNLVDFDEGRRGRQALKWASPYEISYHGLGDDSVAESVNTGEDHLGMRHSKAIAIAQ